MTTRCGKVSSCLLEAYLDEVEHEEHGEVVEEGDADVADGARVEGDRVGLVIRGRGRCEKKPVVVSDYVLYLLHLLYTYPTYHAHSVWTGPLSSVWALLGVITR